MNNTNPSRSSDSMLGVESLKVGTKLVSLQLRQNQKGRYLAIFTEGRKGDRPDRVNIPDDDGGVKLFITHLQRLYYGIKSKEHKAVKKGSPIKDPVKAG